MNSPVFISHSTRRKSCGMRNEHGNSHPHGALGVSNNHEIGETTCVELHLMRYPWTRRGQRSTFVEVKVESRLNHIIRTSWHSQGKRSCSAFVCAKENECNTRMHIHPTCQHVTCFAVVAVIVAIVEGVVRGDSWTNEPNGPINAYNYFWSFHCFHQWKWVTIDIKE